MTDKIKLKADKFVNDKKLKLNYIKPKDLKLLLAESCEEQIAELKAECDFAIEGRDVKIKELEKENTELKKINADGLSELNHINGDLIIENEKLRKENAELKTQIEKVKCTLKKIIETVHNDRINEYGARLVLINDSAYEILQEIEK